MSYQEYFGEGSEYCGDDGLQWKRKLQGQCYNYGTSKISPQP